MRQKTRRIEIYVFTFMFSLASLTSANAGAPLDLVRTTVDRAIQILKDPKLSSPDKKKERVDRLREALAGHLLQFLIMRRWPSGRSVPIGGREPRRSRRSL